MILLMAYGSQYPMPMRMPMPNRKACVYGDSPTKPKQLHTQSWRFFSSFIFFLGRFRLLWRLGLGLGFGLGFSLAGLDFGPGFGFGLGFGLGLGLVLAFPFLFSSFGVGKCLGVGYRSWRLRAEREHLSLSSSHTHNIQNKK
jgi:hypothetical protein